MSLFKKRRAEPADVVVGRHADTSGPVDGEDTPEAAPGESPGASRAVSRMAGPFDASEVDGLQQRIDLGALWLPGREGMELRLELEEGSGRVVAATVAMRESTLQLQAFAAPRTEGIWDEVRAEIAAGVTRQGGTADEQEGPFGTELLARLPVRTPDGRTAHQPARFLGVDGPRWFLRGVIHGAALTDGRAAEAIEGLMRQVVVNRGAEAMAPRDLLALRMPENQQTPEAGAGPTGEGGGSGGEQGRPPLEPFRRGPEITEVR